MQHLGTSCVGSEESYNMIKDKMKSIWEHRKETSNLVMESSVEDEEGLLTKFVNEWVDSVKATINKKRQINYICLGNRMWHQFSY